MRPPPPKGPTPLFQPLHASAAPVRASAAHAGPAAAPAVHQHDDDDDRDDDPRAHRNAGGSLGRRHRHIAQRDAPALRDPPDDARHTGLQPRAVLAAREIRRHVLAHFAGIAVGDELLEVVAHLDPHAPILHRQQHEQPVVFALVADAAAAVLEHLDRVLLDIGVRRLERVDRRDHDDIARRLLQLEDAPLNLGLARVIDDVREIVYRSSQFGWWRLRVNRCDGCMGATRASTISETRSTRRCS